MLYRLQEFGIYGNFLVLTNSFFTGRQINIKVNNYIHPAPPCNIGLPQESVLSPLLFIIYVRDMLSEVKVTSLSCADDCTVLMFAMDDSELQEMLQNNCQIIKTWMAKWKLQVNYQKTEIVVFNGTISLSTRNLNSIQLSPTSKV